MNRRQFLSKSSVIGSGAMLTSFPKLAMSSETQNGFEISLAQWSQHRALKSGELDNLDWPAYVKKNFDIGALEWVNQFFSEEHKTLGSQPKGGSYIKDLKQRCEDNGVVTLLIMCDRVGKLGNPVEENRTHAVEGHYAWLEATKQMGGHSIRVNAASDPKLSWEEQVKLCADGLRRLSEKAATMDMNVIVENHGGLSSNGRWLAEVMKSVNLPNCGTLPDFGNFYVAKNRNPKKFEAEKELYKGEDYTLDDVGIAYDRYRGVEELMPFAKGVSAKSHDFNEEGEEIHTDFTRMMKIVKESGYRGHVGVEYEGSTLSEDEGILATKRLLEKVFVAI